MAISKEDIHMRPAGAMKYGSVTGDLYSKVGGKYRKAYSTCLIYQNWFELGGSEGSCKLMPKRSLDREVIKSFQCQFFHDSCVTNKN